MFKAMIALFTVIMLSASFAPTVDAQQHCDRESLSAYWDFRGC